jgi:hypothetical protein
MLGQQNGKTETRNRGDFFTTETKFVIKSAMKYCCTQKQLSISFDSMKMNELARTGSSTLVIGKIKNRMTEKITKNKHELTRTSLKANSKTIDLISFTIDSY